MKPAPQCPVFLLWTRKLQSPSGPLVSFLFLALGWLLPLFERACVDSNPSLFILCAEIIEWSLAIGKCNCTPKAKSLILQISLLWSSVGKTFEQGHGQAEGRKMAKKFG